jgi:hypothetical protein
MSQLDGHLDADAVDDDLERVVDVAEAGEAVVVDLAMVRVRSRAPRSITVSSSRCARSRPSAGEPVTTVCPRQDLGRGDAWCCRRR